MSRRFVGDPLVPALGEETPAPAAGDPALPRSFTWRGEELRVATVHRSWKETGPCRSSPRERYVRKHWFEVDTTEGRRVRLYFERQARSKSSRLQRWWLFSVES